ncbi:response regulator transcription factor [Amycolatopsis minnesotensis]|uniref:Response regulator transcription factor n=1 Tax=Amycolatopsis minnesotensis TaxID=337894 RepID=A0ABN2RL13_9PSEU
MSERSAAEGPLIRVVLVEDHDMVAEAIALALADVGDIEILARASSVADALDAVGRMRPDVVVLDRRLPDGDGIDAIPELHAVAPGVRVLILTGDATPAVATRVVEAGGAGLLMKAARLADLAVAVRQVSAGDMAFSPDLLGQVLSRLAGRSGAVGAELTGRERETLRLLADGATIADISARMTVARNTARNHVQRILTKLGAHSQLEAVAIARREGLVD